MKLLFVILLALPVVVLAQQANPQKGAAQFTIRGNVKGLPNASRVSLTDVNNPTDTLSSATVKAGQFVLNGHADEPNLYELNLDGVKKKVPLFIGNDKMELSGNTDDLTHLKTSGSPSNDDFTAFQTEFGPHFSRLNTLTQELNTMQGHIAREDPRLQQYKLLIDSILTTLDQFIGKRPSSYVSAFVLVVVNQLTDDVMAQEKRLHSLSAEVQLGYYAQYLSKTLADAQIGAVGSEEIDFTQNDTSGHAVSLSSFKGKYVLVDFWASWCGPCRMENPNVVATWQKFRNKNFTVLGVSLDKAREPWLKAIKDDGLAWTQVSDLKFWYNDVAVKYHIQQIPQNFLIDPNGKIVGRNLRGPDLQAKLCELLGCN